MGNKNGSNRDVVPVILAGEDTNFLEQKEVFTQYLLDRGYHSSLIENAFNKFSDLANRKDLYSLKENNDKTTCLILFNTHGDGPESSTSQHGQYYSQI